MKLPIVLYGNPVLRQKGEDIKEITDEIRQLAQDMIETMHEAHGVGLAAQQIGKALQITVLDVADVAERPSRMWISQQEVELEKYMPMILINPKIEMTKKKEVGEEGCLSFPGITADISRGFRVKVEALDLQGKEIKFEAAGLLGRAVQHEVDHLNGILFIDHISPTTRHSIKDGITAIRHRGQSGQTA
ncbi:MAG: peptide deformylase [Verrucomicrobiota bacterium]